MTYLIVGRDLNPSEPWAGGNLADIYPVLEDIGGLEAEAREAQAKLNGAAVIDNPKLSRAARLNFWRRWTPNRALIAATAATVPKRAARRRW
jgi:hypothetical protein